MFADLKNRFAGARKEQEPGEEAATDEAATEAAPKAGGFNRKRIYTAAVALVVAGAAGHIMQRGGQAPEQADPHLAASQIQPSAPVPEEAQPQDLAMAPAEAATVPDRPAMFAAVMPASLAPASLTPAAAMPAADPASLAPDLKLAENDAPDPAPRMAAPANSFAAEVTRSATVPFSDLPSAKPDAEPNATEVATASPAAPAEPAPVALAAVPSPSEPAPALPDTGADEPFELASITDVAPPAAMPEAAAPDEPAMATCDPAISAEPRAGALVNLTVTAPCNSGEEVEFEQFGLKFSEQLGPDGSLDLMVPAMADDTVIRAVFEDGTHVSTDVFVPDFAGYERAALVWQGATGLQLDAFENGATYGDPGHLWAEAPGTTAQAVAGEGGFVTVLGSTASGFAADVYTYPESLMGATGGPEITIEAQVMENTCGETIEGTFLRARAGQAPSATPVTFAVPPCDAVGDYLVLKNLPQDLKIARN